MKFRNTLIAIGLMAIFCFLTRIDLNIRYCLNTKNVTIWVANKELEFSDFKINKSQKNQIKYTHGFGLLYSTFPFFKVNSFAYFEPHMSSIKDTTSQESILELRFQQIIFDLNELYARKIEFELKSKRKNGNTLLYSEFLELLDRYQIDRDLKKREIENEYYFEYDLKIEKWENWVSQELQSRPR
jgi:hypothetical protein